MFSIKLLNNEVAFEQEATLQFELRENNVVVGASTGKITIKSPSGEVIINQATVSISGSTNLIEYEILSDTFSEKGVNYRIFLEYVYGGNDYSANFLLDVVLTPLVLSVSESDLIERHPNLALDLWDGVDTYTTQIEEAFETVKKDIKNKGNRSSMIIDSSQISILIKFKALEIIFFDFSIDNEGILWDKYLEYKEKYSQELNSINIEYDSNMDGTIDSTLTFGTIDLVR
jgi:hypothetical protein